MPQRVKVQGNYFRGVIPDGAVYVGRAAPHLARSYFHNPFKVGASLDDTLYGEGVVENAEQAVDLFEEYVRRMGRSYRRQAIRYLGGRDLACWCHLDQPCHADVLLVIANPPAPSQELVDLLASVCGYHDGPDCGHCTDALIHARSKGWTDEQVIADIQMYANDRAGWIQARLDEVAAR